MDLSSTLIKCNSNEEAIKIQKLLLELGAKWASGSNKVRENEDIASISVYYLDVKWWLRLIPIFLFKKSGYRIQSADKSWSSFLYGVNFDKEKISGHTNKPFTNVFNNFKEFEDYVNESRKIPSYVY